MNKCFCILATFAVQTLLMLHVWNPRRGSVPKKSMIQYHMCNQALREFWVDGLIQKMPMN